MTQVLLLGDEFHATLAAVRGLRRGGYAPVLAVPLAGTYASYSRATERTILAPDPDRDPDAYADAIVEAARGTAVVLPGTESALVVLSARLELEGVPDRSVVERVVDKAGVLDAARAAGFETPAELHMTTAELAARADELEYPVVVKPVRSKLPLAPGRMRYVTARRIESEFELRALELPEATWLVQPFLAAGLAAIGGVAWEGRLLAAVHQISHRIWPPEIGYSSFAEAVPPNAALEAAAADLVGRLGWSGIFQVQLLRSGDRRYFIDFNPRPYGSLGLAHAAGSNLAAAWADLALGRTPRLGPYRPGVRFRVEHNDVRALLRLAARGEIAAALRGALPRRHTAHAVLTVRDPGPVRALLRKAGRRLGWLPAAWTVALAVMLAAVVAREVLDRPITDFTREPQELAEIPWYSGFVSTAAMLGWWTIAVVCALARTLPFLLTAAAMAYLALDDGFQLHEVVLPDVVGIPQPVVVFAYAALFAAYAYVFRDFLRANGLGLFVLGAALLAVAAAIDLAGDEYDRSWALPEDTAKLLGIATWVVYFGRAAMRAREPARGPERPADGGAPLRAR